MSNYKCTWCNKQVDEQDFDLHTTSHYAKQQVERNINPSTTMTSVGSVSYVKENEMSNSLTIYVNRGQFVWESDIWRGSEKIGSCTGPTLAGVIDLVYEIISESDPQWADFNANERL